MFRKSFVTLWVLVVIVFIPLFGHLDAIPIQLWDESRLADHAMEMIRSSNWIVTKFDGQPDMWMTKPPLMIWLQVLSLKLIGFNELAVRLPAALAALATCMLMFGLFAKKFASPLLGLITAVILVTIPGYVILHGTRTGEYDSLLTFCTTGYAVFFFLYCEDGKQKYLIATVTFLICAALTKGVQGIMFVPAMLIYAIYKRKIMQLLKEPRLYIGIAAFVFFVFGYYLLREHYNPGYIAAVRENELGGRFNHVIEGHSGGGWYYLNLLANEHFGYWFILVIPGTVAGLLSREKLLRELTILVLIFAGSYFIAINSAQTKVYWYLMPLYPFLAILAGVFIHSICMALANIEVMKNITSHNILPFVFLFFVFFIPYQNITRYSLSDHADPNMSGERKDILECLKAVLHGRCKISASGILGDDFGQDQEWYKLVFKQEDRQLPFISREEVPAEGKVIAFMPDSKRFLEEHYNTQVLDSFRSMKWYQLCGRKMSGQVAVK